MRFKKASALVIALALVGVACGDDDNESSGDTAAPAATDAAPGDTAAAGDTTPPSAGGTLIVSTDLPLQGASADASADTNNAVALLLEQAGACIVCASHDEELIGVADQIIDLGTAHAACGVTCQ